MLLGIKGCPFCGGSAYYKITKSYKTKPTHKIKCNWCPGRMETTGSYEDTLELWNKRTETITMMNGSTINLKG